MILFVHPPQWAATLQDWGGVSTGGCVPGSTLLRHPGSSPRATAYVLCLLDLLHPLPHSPFLLNCLLAVSSMCLAIWHPRACRSLSPTLCLLKISAVDIQIKRLLCEVFLGSLSRNDPIVPFSFSFSLGGNSVLTEIITGSYA